MNNPDQKISYTIGRVERLEESVAILEKSALCNNVRCKDMYNDIQSLKESSDTAHLPLRQIVKDIQELFKAQRETSAELAEIKKTLAKQPANRR